MTRRRPLPPFVELWRDRHGRIRVYFRRARGPRIALPVDIRSPEFAAAYHECLTGSALSDAMAARNAAPPGSIEALIRSYRATREYGELRATTRSGYDFQLESLRREHGHRSVSGMTRANIEKLLARLADRPGAALARLKMLKVLIAHAIVKGWLTHDPSLKIKRPKGGKIHTWTEGELAQFEARWPVGSKERLAFALHRFTGQRRSDVYKMCWTDIAGDEMQITQQKTGTEVTIPLHLDLQSILSQTRREHVTILNNKHGKPFTVKSYSGWMRTAIREAGLPLKCQPHGLRRAAAVALAEVGCSTHEIAAITGHLSLKEVENYTRQADRKRLARSGMARLTLAQAGNELAQTVAQTS